MTLPITLLLDADSLVYKYGFAGQLSSLQIAYEDGGDGSLKTRGFTPDGKLSVKKQLAAWLEAEKAAGREHEVLDEHTRVDADPVSHVLHSVGVGVEDIIRDTKVDTWRLFLTGKGNYREQIAKQRPYKGNRIQAKPVHYDAIRDYLVRHWSAEMIEGEEADDKVSILGWEAYQAELPVIIASIDKDLDQVPGKHYDYMKKVHYDVRPDEAEFVFYRQCISGDSVDNVPGCYKIGPEKAEALLNSLPRSLWWKAVLDAYRASTAIAGCPYALADIEAIALETAQLVRMRTFVGELWTPSERDIAGLSEVAE